MSTLQLYTDGSYNYQSNQGGAGYVLVDGDKILSQSSLSCRCSNNYRMEMWAVIFGLGRTPKKYKKIRIYTDLKKIVEYKNHLKEIIEDANYPDKDLLLKIENHASRFKEGVEFEWVKSKSGNRFHHLADKLAFEKEKAEHSFIDNVYEKYKK